MGTLLAVLALNSSELVDIVITPTKSSAPRPARGLRNFITKAVLTVNGINDC